MNIFSGEYPIFLEIPPRSQRADLQTLGVTEPHGLRNNTGVRGFLRGAQHEMFQVPRVPFDELLPKASKGSVISTPKRKQIRMSPRLSPLEVSLVKAASIWTHKRGQSLIQCPGPM